MKDYYHLNIKSKNLKIIRRLILLISIVLFIYQIYYFEFYRSALANNAGNNAHFYLIVIALQIFLLLAFRGRRRILTKQNFNLNAVLVIFLLLITPFIGAFGTANLIFLNSLIHSATWFGVIVILSFYLSKYIKGKIIISIFVLIPCLVTVSQIVDGNLFVPYYSVFNQNKSNFFEQNEQVKNIPLLDGIQVDLKTKVFLTELNQVLEENNFKNGYPIFGFHIPGVVYLLEGTSPGMPYYYNKNRDNKAFESFKFDNNPPIIMVTEKNPINDELLSTMQTKGINFPDDFILKGEVYFPNTDSLLKVYFPHNY
jgi:hypothetical protein